MLGAETNMVPFRVLFTTALTAALFGISPKAQDALSQPQEVVSQPQDIVSQPQQTFRSAVDLVTIQASVRDGRGRVVSGLTTRDFEVRDNGELRPILSLRADRESPLSLAILVDMSGSMRVGPKIAMARQAYEAILAQLRQGQDEVGLF